MHQKCHSCVEIRKGGLTRNPCGTPQITDVRSDLALFYTRNLDHTAREPLQNLA